MRPTLSLLRVRLCTTHQLHLLSEMKLVELNSRNHQLMCRMMRESSSGKWIYVAKLSSYIDLDDMFKLDNTHKWVSLPLLIAALHPNQSNLFLPVICANRYSAGGTSPSKSIGDTGHFMFWNELPGSYTGMWYRSDVNSHIKGACGDWILVQDPGLDSKYQ